MLSIIIPTLNEEKYLFLLLESIKKQNLTAPQKLLGNLTATQKLLRNFDDLEIIVVDAGSEDKTIEIAKSYHCKIAPGSLPSKARNQGANISQGELLLFVDGDTVLPENFLENILKEFKERNLDVGSFFLYPYRKNGFLKFLYNLFYNWWPALALEKILPHASNAILVKKELHQKLGGFDEKIKIGEDHAYVRAGAKIGKFGILRSSNIMVLTERFNCDGWLRTYLKYLLAELYMIFIGNVKSDVLKYHSGYYRREKNKKLLKNSGIILKSLKFLWQALWLVTLLVIALILWPLFSLILILGITIRILAGQIRYFQI